jgi:hypothetical protein
MICLLRKIREMMKDRFWWSFKPKLKMQFGEHLQLGCKFEDIKLWAAQGFSHSLTFHWIQNVIKMWILNSHPSFTPINLGVTSEHGECFHQEASILEKRCQIKGSPQHVGLLMLVNGKGRSHMWNIRICHSYLDMITTKFHFDWLKTGRWNKFLGYVGSEVLTAEALKRTIFWDITPCSSLSVNRRFGRESCLHHKLMEASSWFLFC